MPCVSCFFSRTFQKELKLKTFGTSRFENRLLAYMTNYLFEIEKLVSTDKCNCPFRLSNADYIKWTDDFLKSTIQNIEIIKKTFQIFSEIYFEYISGSQKGAMDKMWDFIIQNNLATGSENPINFSQLLFRARSKENALDITNPETFFHIPFTKRFLIGN